jgi:hypothetical protein
MAPSFGEGYEYVPKPRRRYPALERKIVASVGVQSDSQKAERLDRGERDPSSAAGILGLYAAYVVIRILERQLQFIRSGCFARAQAFTHGIKRRERIEGGTRGPNKRRHPPIIANAGIRLDARV